MKSLGEMLDQRLVVLDDARAVFVSHAPVPFEQPLFPHGHPVPITVGGRPWLAYGRPFPSVRVPADLASLADPAAYEAFTCLAEGARFRKGETVVPEGATWAWRRDVSPMDPETQQDLLDRGLPASRAWLHLRDVETGKPVRAHGGSVAWNEHRRRWIAIVLESWGTSFLGEIWYAEADTLLGPWVYARKIVTHDDYSFYNPKHHPELDRDGGRRIFFEGTYTMAFSGAKERTPWYDYNQVMYALSLDDPRLELPVPVYGLEDGSFATRAAVEAGAGWGAVRTVACFAFERAGEGRVAFPGAVFAPGILAPGHPGANLVLHADGEGRLVGDASARAVARAWPSPSPDLPLDRESGPRSPPR
jgi:hypothetical protein